MDTPTAPTEAGNLDLNQAADAFAAVLQPEDKPKDEKPQAAEPTQDEPDAGPNAQEEGDDAPLEPSGEKVTVEIDGKTVELTKEQVAEAYKAGLRQDDYTRKTQELADKRKAAEAETAQAREERSKLAGELQRHQAMLEGALQQQQNIDWQALLESDPVEYLKQQHLAQTRHAALQKNQQQMEQLQAQAKAEHEAAYRTHITNQREQLLAKIPEWKDEAKLKAGTQEIKDYLLKSGYTESEISSVHDHRAVLNVRKAMLYDQMMAKAQAAAKKIQNTPNRVERPSGGEPNNLDRRAASYQKLAKSGRVEDAAALIAGLI